MRCVAEVSSFNLMYNLCMYYEKKKSYDKTELTFQPTLVIYKNENVKRITISVKKKKKMTSLQAPAKQVIHPKIDDRKRFLSKSTHCRKKKTLKKRKEKKKGQHT